MAAQRHADVLPCRVTDVGLDVVERVFDHLFGQPLVVRRVAVLVLHIRQVGVSFGGWVLVFDSGIRFMKPVIDPLAVLGDLVGVRSSQRVASERTELVSEHVDALVVTPLAVVPPLGDVEPDDRDVDARVARFVVRRRPLDVGLMVEKRLQRRHPVFRVVLGVSTAVDVDHAVEPARVVWVLGCGDVADPPRGDLVGGRERLVERVPLVGVRPRDLEVPAPVWPSGRVVRGVPQQPLVAVFQLVGDVVGGAHSRTPSVGAVNKVPALTMLP